MAEDALTFSGDGLEALARDVLAAAESLQRAMTPTLARAGQQIAMTAREIALDNGSTSIPGTITGRLRDARTYVVSAGNSSVPLAVLWEIGNRGASRSSKTFTHPTFGHAPWVEQEKKPFLRPALNANRKEIVVQMETTAKRSLAAHRLGPESVIE